MLIEGEVFVESLNNSIVHIVSHRFIAKVIQQATQGLSKANKMKANPQPPETTVVRNSRN
jgi:hypothetical protein